MEISKNKILLTLPNKLKYITLTQSLVREMATIMGYVKSEILKLELAVEEAAKNIIEHSFAPGEETTFDIIIEPHIAGIIIQFKDKGFPFDPTEIPDYNPKIKSNILEAKGLGTFLIKQLVDEVTYLNLGKNGKEIVLFKYLNKKSIKDIISKLEIEKAEEDKKTQARTPVGFENFKVRRMTPDEAIAVSKCAYTTYGLTYVHEDIYFPERVREMNIKGELISYVAINDNNEIMGHIALEIEVRDTDFPQLGMAFVNPKFQGHGCMKSMNTKMIEDAVMGNFYGIYARGVTTHPFSQKVIGKFGFQDTAIFLSSGVSREYKGIREDETRRESVVIMANYLHPSNEMIIYPPKEHINIIKKVYNNLGLNPKFSDSIPKDVMEKNQSIIKVNIDNVNHIAIINVIEYGKDVLYEIKKSLNDFCHKRYETIYLNLKLRDPLTAKYSSEFEKMNFFFSGIMPGSDNNDELVLQYLNNYIADYDKVMIDSDFGKELKEYIKSQDPQTKNNLKKKENGN